jgi:hypothetical protein
MVSQKTQNDISTGHGRTQVKAMSYVLRAYVFAARRIEFGELKGVDPALFCRVSCAGATNETNVVDNDLRPSWMKCVHLNIALMSDHPKKPPTVEPITISLCEGKLVCE